MSGITSSRAHRSHNAETLGERSVPLQERNVARGCDENDSDSGSARIVRRLGVTVGLLFALLMIAPSHALAQADPDELARRHFESGAAYFEQAEYDNALREFRKAYELSQRPQILRNISVVEERLGNLEKAIEALDAYLAVSPSDPDIETVRIRRDNLVKRQRTQEAQRAPDVEQAPPANTEPSPTEVREAQPQATRHPRAGAQPEDQTVQQPNLVPAYVSLTIGGLAGAGALLTGIVAKIEYDDLETTCGSTCTNDETRTGENLALTSTVLTGVSLVGISVGIVLWATADGGEERGPLARSEPTLDVRVNETGASFAARWVY